MQNLESLEYRKQILKEIDSQENKDRKADSFRRSEIMKNRQGPYIEAKLKEEFSAQTVQEMRKVKSINVAPRMIEEQAKIYLEAPLREFVVEGKELDQEATKQALALYELPDVDNKLLKFHRMLKYQKQAFLQVVPTRGMLDVRVYQPHQLDVIPMDNDPEQAFAYIISAYDRSQSLNTGDGVNQKIADKSDKTNEEKNNQRFVWWSAEHNFITDGHGMIIGDQDDIANPIGRLPFVEGADGKENEFWVREGAPEIDFAIDLAVILSDNCNTNRLQAYSQAILSAFEKPTQMKVGPNDIIFLQLEKEQTAQPSFSFASPNSDIIGSIQLMDTLVNLFLTAKGIDPKTVNSKGESNSFASGFERLLATLKDFEASREDISLLERVERELFEIFLAWHEAFKGTSNSPLKDAYSLINLPSDAELLVSFAKPELVQTKKETEDSIIKLQEKGYRSKVMAMMELDQITEEQAIEKLKKIEEHNAMFAKSIESELPDETQDDQPKKKLPEGQGTKEIQEELPV